MTESFIPPPEIKDQYSHRGKTRLVINIVFNEIRNWFKWVLVNWELSSDSAIDYEVFDLQSKLYGYGIRLFTSLEFNPLISASSCYHEWSNELEMFINLLLPYPLLMLLQYSFLTKSALGSNITDKTNSLFPGSFGSLIRTRKSPSFRSSCWTIDIRATVLDRVRIRGYCTILTLISSRGRRPWYHWHAAKLASAI